MLSTIPFGEDFLHYIWQHKAFDFSDLCTTTGASLQIVAAGKYNKNAGADFSEAKIYIDGVLWVGDVEIHLRASDWRAHGHSGDTAYERVVLHVVFDPNQPIFYPDGTEIPMLSLQNRISADLISRYKSLIDNEYWVACQAHLPQALDDTDFLGWLAKMGIERLEWKMKAIARQLEATQNNWSELLYWNIAQALGADVNGAAMLALAQSLPLLTIAKHKDNLTQIEALLFGQSGLLQADSEDKYEQILWREYDYLRKKYQLYAINPTHWRFSRMRPANFPTLRIAQLAQLLHQSEHLFAKIIDTVQLKNCEKLFRISLHSFWDNHYLLGKVSETNSRKTLGKTGRTTIMLNTVVPLLFAYGKLRHREELMSRALSWLCMLPAEENQIIDNWLSLGATAINALETQALLHLYKYYCTPRHCLDCAVGKCLLRKNE